jgi:hypothetical protein
MMDDPLHDSVALHLAKLLGQHLLGDRGHRSFEVGKPQQLAAEQVKEDQAASSGLPEF